MIENIATLAIGIALGLILAYNLSELGSCIIKKIKGHPCRYGI